MRLQRWGHQSALTCSRKTGTNDWSLFSITIIPSLPPSHFTSIRPPMMMMCPAATIQPRTIPWPTTCDYKDFTRGPNKRLAKCRVCRIKIKDLSSPWKFTQLGRLVSCESQHHFMVSNHGYLSIIRYLTLAWLDSLWLNFLKKTSVLFVCTPAHIVPALPRL